MKSRNKTIINITAVINDVQIQNNNKMSKIDKSSAELRQKERRPKSHNQK